MLIRLKVTPGITVTGRLRGFWKSPFAGMTKGDALARLKVAIQWPYWTLAAIGRYRIEFDIRILIVRLSKTYVNIWAVIARSGRVLNSENVNVSPEVL